MTAQGLQAVACLRCRGASCGVRLQGAYMCLGPMTAVVAEMMMMMMAIRDKTRQHGSRSVAPTYNNHNGPGTSPLIEVRSTLGMSLRAYSRGVARVSAFRYPDPWNSG
jgi:hypothetical protein